MSLLARRHQLLAEGDTGGGGTPPGGTGRVWWDPPARQIYTPTGAGSNVNVTNATELGTALTNATPGDCINLASGNYGTLVWSPEINGHTAGVSGAPITVQAQAGASVEFVGAGTSVGDCVRITDMDYFRLSGVTIRNAWFNFRVWSCTFGEILHCNIHDSGHANFSIQDYSYESPYNGTTKVGGVWGPHPTHDILVEDCQVWNSGRILSAGEPFGEGIYIGIGTSGEEWTQSPYNIEIRWCEIYNTIGDGVDIKPGSRNIYVHHNQFHDMDVPAGSVVTHGPTAIPDPTVGVEKRIEIHDNRIWNIGHSNQQAGQTSAYGIQCWLGGEKIWNNLLWGFADHGVNTRGINIRGLAGGSASAYSLDVYNNTIWTDYSISNVYNITPPTININNNLTQDGRQSTTQVTSAVFAGTIPSLYAESDAIAAGETAEGSAFTPATSTSVPAATTGLIADDDLTGLARPIGQQTEQGALEYLAP